MRHRNHRHSLGVKKEHREALMANLAAALFRHGRIETTLTKAKALRPFAEKIITLAKKAAATDDAARKLHYRRQAIARVRDKVAVKALFDERVQEFVNRKGGYIRIYKLIPRASDATAMGVIELVAGDDEGYTKPKRNRKPAKKAKAEQPAAEAETATAVAEAPAEDASSEPQAAEGDAPAEEEKKD